MKALHVLCEDTAQPWQAPFPLHLAPDALLLPEVKLGCTDGKQKYFGQVALLGSQEKDVPQLVFAIQHILPFRKADDKVPVYPGCNAQAFPSLQLARNSGSPHCPSGT